MSIRSLFGRKDKGSSSSTSPLMPQLPSIREMIDDIENIKKNDPILSLAAIIEKKSSQGRHSVVDSDIKELMEALRKRRKSEEQSSSSSSAPVFRLPSFKGQSFSKDSSEVEKMESKKSKTKGSESKKALSSATNAAEQTLNYDKLKHFLTTCEHSQELISNLEPEFKRLNQEIAEYSKSFDIEYHSADSESESKLT